MFPMFPMFGVPGELHCFPSEISIKSRRQVVMVGAEALCKGLSARAQVFAQR